MLSHPPGFNPADVQGNIVRGYRYKRVRHVMLEIANRRLARRWLRATVSGVEGVPAITTEEHWDVKPESCFNIAFTAPGLRILRVSEASLKTFPDEFLEGMEAQAVKLGDIGTSAPDHWPAPFDDPTRIHMIASIHADDIEHLDSVERQIPVSDGAKAFEIWVRAMAGISMATMSISTITTIFRSRALLVSMTRTGSRTSSRLPRSVRS